MNKQTKENLIITALISLVLLLFVGILATIETQNTTLGIFTFVYFLSLIGFLSFTKDINV